MVAMKPGSSMWAVKDEGETPAAAITTRFVGLPCGTARDAVVATTTTPSRKGAVGIRHHRPSDSTSGTMSTTEPSSETIQVKSPQRPQTRRKSASVHPRATRASAAAVVSTRPDRTTGAAGDSAAVRNAARGTTTETVGPAPAPSATSAHATNATAAAEHALRGFRARSATAAAARAAWATSMTIG
jgi:hypothetical protein